MKITLGLALVVNLFFIKTSFAELLTIANKNLSVSTQLTSIQIKELLLGNTTSVNNINVELVICKKINTQLISAYCDTSIEKFRKNWIKKIFLGGNLPPVILNTCTEVNNYLKTKKNAIGFAEFADKNIKILHKNEKIVQ